MGDLLEELAEQGMDPETIERIRAWNDGSPIRKENKSVSRRNQDLETENATLRKSVMAQTFAKVGIPMDPSVLQLPADLAIHDEEAVRAWAQGAKLIPTEPTADPGELESHDRTAAMANGSPPPSSGVITPAVVKEWSTEKIMRFKQDHPQEFELLKQGEEVSGISFPN